MEQAQEKWLPVVGWEDFYEVSSLGKVRSKTRTVRRRFNLGFGHQTYIGREISIYSGDGRSCVRLSGGGVKATKKVHRLVAEAFLGHCPPGKEVAHGNGNFQDNRLCNLRYATPKENCADKIKHGTHHLGERCHNAKLTADLVRTARSLPKGKIRAFADEFGLNPRTLYQVRSRDTWRHI